MSATSRAGTSLAIAVAGLLLAGCASSGPEFGGGHHRYANGQPHYTVAPYQVNGVWYYPKVDYSYEETGTASWYGPGFDHRATADGEIYDMNQLSAAHKTLPLPSIVEVTNLQNGRELHLRVNDRGPFVSDRLIDVSRRAAQLLGFEGTGTTQVRVKVLKDESIQVAQAAMLGQIVGVGVAAAPAADRTEMAAIPPPRRRMQVAAAAPPPRSEQIAAAPLLPSIASAPPEPEATQPSETSAPRRRWPSLIAPAEAATLPAPVAPMRVATRERGRIFVQAGAFAVPENAQRVRARIAVFGAAEIVPGTKNGASLYRVRVGPVRSEAEAQQLLSKVVDHGYRGARLVKQ